MRSLFSIHAGEYLVGTAIEKHLKKKYDVWLPSKDTGIDLLLTGVGTNKVVKLQVKFSKDYASFASDSSIKAYGWFTLNRKKIIDSKADFWVFVLYHPVTKAEEYIILTPQELLNIYRITYPGTSNNVQTDFISTTKKKAYEARSAKKEALSGNLNGSVRDVSKHLNEWGRI